jgi:hypothetical protein
MNLEWASRFDSITLSVTLVTLEDSHRMPISLQEQPAIVDFGNYTTCHRKEDATRLRASLLTASAN